MILGLDISTAITGYTVLDVQGKVVLCSHVDFKKCESLFEKSELFKTEIKTNVFDKFSIDEVWIESSLLSFSGGKSSASVIATLTKFNGILSYIVERDFGFKPQFIMATSARKKIGLKIIKGTKAKEQVKDYVLANEKWYVPTYKKTGKIKDHCYDEIDSWVIARAGFVP